MPLNKNPDDRYRIIYEKISTRSGNLAAVKLQDLADELGISLRQLNTDIKYMREELDVPLRYNGQLRGWQCDKDFLFLNDRIPMSKKEVMLLRMAMEMFVHGGQSDKFRALPDIFQKIYKASRDWMGGKITRKAVWFDPLPEYKGAEFLDIFLDAIQENRRVRFEYRSFRSDDPGRIVEFDPYFLRHYERRWYVGGQPQNTGEAFIRVFPLDRIMSKPEIIGFYHDKSGVENAASYWKNIYGITVPPGRQVEDVVLQFSEIQWPYFLSSPFFEPYKIIDKDARMVSMQLIPNLDLKMKIASLGPQVRVLAPEWFVQEVDLWKTR